MTIVFQKSFFMKKSTLTSLEKISAALMRRYPLKSGCGTLATSKLANWLVPPRPETAIGDVCGRKCLVPLDDLVGRSIFLVGDLDPKVSWVIDRYVKPADTVLDIGANLGLVTLLMSARVGLSGSILMFEPARDMLAFLKATIEMNDDLDVKLFPFALGRIEQTLTLSVPDHNAGRASLVPNTIEVAKENYDVDVKRLADVLRGENITSIDFLKVDVEGFESEVFAGLFDDPGAPRPRLILFEENRPEQSGLFDDLHHEGYAIFGLPRRFVRTVLVPEGHPDFLSCHDYIAAHSTAELGRLAALGIHR